MVAALCAGHPPFVVRSVSDIDAGLIAVERDHPDIVLLDLGFPDGRSGVELIHQLRARGIEVPVVIYTSHHDPLESFELGQLGSVAYVQKTTDFSKLFGALHVAAGRGGDALQRIARKIRAGLDDEGRRSLRSWLIGSLAQVNNDVWSFRTACAAIKVTPHDVARLDVAEVLRVLDEGRVGRVRLDDLSRQMLHAMHDAPADQLLRSSAVRPDDAWLFQRLKDATGLSRDEWAKLERLRRAVHQLLTTNEHVRQISLALKLGHGGQLWRDVVDLAGLAPRDMRAIIRTVID